MSNDEVFDACITDSEDEVEKEIPSNIAEDISFKRSLSNIHFVPTKWSRSQVQ